MKPKFVLIAFVSTLFAMLTFTSCQKKTDCVATVICKDVNGLPLRGAAIQLFAIVRMPPSNTATVTADVRANGVSDENGKATFTFKLPAIFDIKASVGTATATGIIKLEVGSSVETSLTLQ